MADTYPSVAVPSTVNFDSSEDQAESKLQVKWSNMMDQGNYRKSSVYKRVEVMMLHFSDGRNKAHPHNGQAQKNKFQTSIEEEVLELKRILEGDFGFNVTQEHLNNKDDLQSSINVVMANWVHKHNSLETLLIVYYAGHGKPGVNNGELRIHGTTVPSDKSGPLNQCVWNNTEFVLKGAHRPDVLQIFDCCYAGSLGRGHDSRSFEYIAACEHNRTTPVPGDDSFTSALIWALKKLLKEKDGGRFTTKELLWWIKNKAPNFPREQVPVLVDRENEDRGGRIMLHPLKHVGRRPSTPDPKSPRDEEKRQTLTLHFELSEKLTEHSVEILGHSMNKIFELESVGVNIGVNRVRWGGIRQSVFAQAVNQFRRISQHRPSYLTPSSISAPSPFLQSRESLSPSSTSNSHGAEFGEDWLSTWEVESEGAALGEEDSRKKLKPLHTNIKGVEETPSPSGT